VSDLNIAGNLMGTSSFGGALARTEGPRPRG